MNARKLLCCGLALAALAGCSDKPTPFCLHCDGGYRSDPAIARRLTHDTGLPICDAARFLDVTTPAQRSDTLTPEYEVYAMLDHCPVEARLKVLTAHGQAVLETPAGLHVTIMLGDGSYDIRVWHPAAVKGR